MQLDNDQICYLQDLFSDAELYQDKLNQWELNFIEDNQRRFMNDEGGNEGYFVSPKMWGIFRNIREKLDNDVQW